MHLCLRDPIPEIFEASRHLDAAVSAHLAGQMQVVAELFRLADMPEIREWTESLWGKNSPYVVLRAIPDAPVWLPKDQRAKLRMPSKGEKRMLQERDGFRCRFCGIPVIRKEIRERIKTAYPDALLRIP